MKKIIRITLALAISFLAMSCQNSDKDPSIDHILIVYMGGDNNLAWEVDEKIAVISQGWNKKINGKIVVYRDSQGKNSQLLEMDGSTTGKLIEEYENENSADHKVFARVLQDVRKMYAAPSYGLLVFSHASGWIPAGTYNNPRMQSGIQTLSTASTTPQSSIAPRSIIIDQRDEMDIPDFANAIPNKGFDYIILEACLMGGVEVAYELKDKADYILFSSAEIVSPGYTHIYSKHISDLFKGHAGLLKFAQAGFDYWDNEELQVGNKIRSGTFSIAKTTELEPLAQFIAQKANFTASVNINEIQRFGRFSNRALYFDFDDYYTRLLTNDTDKKELTNLLAKAVVWKKATPYFFYLFGVPQGDGFKIDKHSGLTSYIEQARYPVLNAAYKEMAWAKAIGAN